MSMIDGMNAASLAMTAQAQRLNTISGNIANMDTVASSPDQAFKARLVQFKTVSVGDAQTAIVTDVVDSLAAHRPIYDPTNPIADDKGYVYASNVNREEQMADLMEAEQAYLANAKVAKTLKDITLKTINAIKSNQ